MVKKSNFYNMPVLSNVISNKDNKFKEEEYL